MHALLFSLLPFAFGAAACRTDAKADQDQPAVSASAAPAVSLAATAAATPSAAPARKAAAAELAAQHKARMSDGRKASARKDWPAAVLAFEAALKAVPGDPRALSDLGYVAYLAGDLDKARRTNVAALAAATTPAQRAAVLFNQGLVEEKLGHPAQAAERYAASLEQRPSEIVERRLAALGETHSPCAKNFVDVEALCECRNRLERDQVLLAPGDADASPRCTDPHVNGIDGLRILRWGSGEMAGENLWFAAARGSGGWTRVAQLGTDYEPGAFGVHNSAKVDKVEEHLLEGRRVAWIHWSEDNVDMNLAGLEIRSYSARHATLCVLDAQPRCPVSLVLEETQSLEYADVAADTEDALTLAELKRKEPPFSRSSRAELQLEPSGVVRVTEHSGQRKELAPFVKGVKLW